MRRNSYRQGEGFLLPALLAAGIALAVSACSTADLKLYPEQDLVDQRLKPRAGHPGKLTYLICAAKDKKTGDCTQEVIKEVDLAADKSRATLNQMGFICNIAGERYKVCEDSAGFCQITQAKKCPYFWCGSEEVVAKRLDAVSDAPYLLGAGTRCFQVNKYPFSP